MNDDAHKQAHRGRGPPDHIRLEGPRPFVTLRISVHDGLQRHWPSRQIRKGLSRFEGLRRGAEIPVWRTERYNWFIGLIFSVGAVLFMAGSVLSLIPADAVFAPSPVFVAVVFFIGSIPFTTAAYLQHFQSANALRLDSPDDSVKRIALLGWRPRNAGWWSTLCQFAGTIAFNFNTFDAIEPAQDWVREDLAIWLPGVIGSVLFLVSAYLAFIEVCHRYWAWKVHDLDWKIAFVNLVGCIAFMTAGLLAFVPEGPEPGWVLASANIHLGFGAFCFLIGALLLMRESLQAASVAATTS